MKAIKILILFVSLFAVNSISAQSTVAKWPAMKTYDEVINRINNGVTQGNEESILAFTKTLYYFSQQLTATEIPEQFNTPKIKAAVGRLQEQTAILNQKVVDKASNDDLKPIYLETYSRYKQVIELMTSPR